MSRITAQLNGRMASQRGVSLPEVVIVLLVCAIIAVLALPHFMSSKQLRVFSEFQQRVVAGMNEARNQAMTQKKRITFRYEDSRKRAVLWGGSFGPAGDAKNKLVDLTVEGLDFSDVRYGQPEGVDVDRLADTSRAATLENGVVELTFEPDGTMVDGSRFPLSRAIFFYHDKYRIDSAFAISVLGGSGRVKAWRYRTSANTYLE